MVGCVEREGRGNRGAWAAPAGVLGGRPLWGPPSLPPVLGGPASPGGWARRPRKEEQLETALGRRDGEWAHLGGKRGLTRGRRKRPEPGGSAWVAVQGVPTPAAGSRPRKRGAGACRRREAAGLAGHQDPLFPCSPAERRARGERCVGRESFRVRGVDVLPRFIALLACRLGEVGKPSGLEVLPSGTRASDPRLPCSWLSAPHPHPILFPEPRPSVFLLASSSPAPQSQAKGFLVPLCCPPATLAACPLPHHQTPP